jgi:hypothetical protein
MDPGTIAVIGLCAFLALWYGVAHLYNRYRGQQIFRWLKAGLDVLGGEVEAGWIGSPASGARINVTHAKPPFRRLEITLLLENREVPLLWLLDHLRGRQDGLIIRATLRSPRRAELEIGSARRRAARRRQSPWTWQDGPHRLAIASLGPGAKRLVATLQPWLGTYGAHVRRLSWRKADPHIQLHVKLSKLHTIDTTSSATFLADLQAAMDVGKHAKN